MQKRNLLFTGKALPQECKEKLESLGFNVIVEKPNLTEDELIEALKDVSAHILCGAEKFTARVLQSAPKLRIISFFGVGYDTYIDAKAATANGIAVTNAPGANAQSVAEFTIALILDAIKQTPHITGLTKQGVWQKDVSWDLKGRKLGIIGMGEVGARLAKIAHHGFGMEVLYYSRTKKTAVEKDANAQFVELDELLNDADVVSLHTIETGLTKEMIGRKQLESMKPHAILVNTARASLVDLKALYEALVNETIACAAFDCYYQEPAPNPKDDKYGLLQLSNSRFLLSPHAAFFSQDAALKTAEMSIENISALFEGNTPPNLVNPDYIEHVKQPVS